MEFYLNKLVLSQPRSLKSTTTRPAVGGPKTFWEDQRAGDLKKRSPTSKFTWFLRFLLSAVGGPKQILRTGPRTPRPEPTDDLPPPFSTAHHRQGTSDGAILPTVGPMGRWPAWLPPSVPLLQSHRGLERLRRTWLSPWISVWATHLLITGTCICDIRQVCDPVQDLDGQKTTKISLSNISDTTCTWDSVVKRQTKQEPCSLRF